MRKDVIETPSQLALVRRTVPVPDREPVIDTDTLQRVGGQLGTNPAGIYQDDSGQRYYVKTLDSQAHARNEFIAAKPYQLAGAPTLTYVHTKAADQIATEWVELDKKCIATSAKANVNRRNSGSVCMPGPPTGMPPGSMATIRKSSMEKC